MESRFRRTTDMSQRAWLGVMMLIAFPVVEFSDTIARAQEVPVATSTANTTTTDQFTLSSNPQINGEASKSTGELKKMSLEELMDVEVSSVSKRESTVGQSPAAVSVITNDDIRRSGATSIPEALRMVPGLEVARIDNSTWAVSSRGFNSSSANKLLVMIDGRSVYTPLFSGVFWDVQDTNMEDIDRIEVIRGPAGALWGGNAVNGVINIITKSAKDTQGGMVQGGGGTEERNFGTVRYGWKLADDAWARIYVKHFERDETVFSNGADGQDDWMMTQAGFRIDGEPSSNNHYAVHGDAYVGSRNNAPTAFIDGKTDLAGGNITGVWDHKLNGDGGDVRLQAYYDRTDRDIPGTFKEARDTFDVDFQHHFPLGTRQDITWGLGYRISIDQVDNSNLLVFDPSHAAHQTISAFVQDEIQVVKDKLRLTLGSKFEYNDYSGFEVQPSARLLWSIDKRQAAWGAISRAVRTPSRLDTDLVINTVVPPGPNVVSIVGDPDFDSEEVLAYELGYRIEPVDYWAIDVAAFFNSYDRLQSIEAGTPFVAPTPPPPHTVIPFTLANNLHGNTYGLEVGSTWKIRDWWVIRGAYTYLEEDLEAEAGSTDTTSVAAAGNNPHNQIYLHSGMDLPHNVQFDCNVRFVDTLPTSGVSSYIAVDVRVAWQPAKNWELAVVAQNLFDDRHPEFGTAATRHEIERGVYGMATYKW